MLLSLRDGTKHGYEIATYVKEKGKGFFSISFGSLYPVLHKLEKDGLIKGAWKDVGNAKTKKVYSLTAKGRKGLELEVSQYKEFVSVMVGLMELSI